jgi:membrane-associated phospholipid phosphatase
VPRPRPFHLPRPEWCLAALLLAAAIFVRFVVRPPAASLRFELYYQLASAFTSGVAVSLLIVLGERLLAPLERVTRSRGRWIWRLATAGLALAIFLTIRPPRATPLTRLLESTALSLGCTVVLLALFLPVSGLLRARDLTRAVTEVLGRWLPLLAYLVAAGPLMAATLVSTPHVLDPVLMRMDLSLGFSPSETIFAWEYDLAWVRILSTWGYPLLGLFFAAVAATLHLAGAAAQCRRCLLALTLVATFGLACYQLAPAVGPLHAFPALFQHPADTPALSARAADIRRAIVAGPDRIPGSLAHPRNVMPSLHTAFTLVALAAAWSWRRRFFWLCLPVGLVQIFTALTLCVHYAVDVIAAVPFAAACWTLADRLIRRSPLSEESPLPPLAAHRPRAFLLSVVAALAALLLWAKFAPLAPALAWPLVALIVSAPAWLVLRSVVSPLKPDPE